VYPQSAPLALNRKDTAQAIDSLKVAVHFDLAFIRSYIPGKRT
jgi:hypothetical protein